MFYIVQNKLGRKIPDRGLHTGSIFKISCANRKLYVPYKKFGLNSKDMKVGMWLLSHINHVGIQRMLLYEFYDSISNK